MRWLYFPPVFSFVFLIITAALHDRTAAVTLPPPIWGIIIAAYVCLCALSLFFIVGNDSKYDVGVFTLTQGLMISVLSVQFGVTFTSWIGLVLFLVGLMLVFFYATRKTAYVEEIPKESANNGVGTFERTDSLIEKLAFPICYTDNAGVIAGATAKFCEIFGLDEDDILGKLISDLLPIDSEETVLESGRWGITQKKEGSRYYFSLTPVYEEKVLASPVAEPPAGILVYDNTTGLYTDEYRKIRGPEEVSRAQRYKRPLSGLLLALTFEPSSTVTITKEQEEMLENAFKTRVQAALRVTDCGFLMPDGRMQILLPETPQGGAKTLLSRIITMPQDIFDEEIRSAVNPKVLGGLFFYNGTTRMEYGIFSAALEESVAKSKQSGTIQTAQATQAA